MSFTLSSPAFTNAGLLPQSQVFSGMGQTGANLSPALAWSGVPAGTKSIVVTCYDPDAPTGSGWWHWLVVNLPPDTTGLPEGAGSGKGGLPAGALETRTDFGAPGYGGAAPPPGHVHRYEFTVYALDIEKLDVTADTPAAQIGYQANHHCLAKTKLTALYGS